ncbi:MAG: hypothetical protein EOP51_21185 [Sphingobacteriales bacterium]|nr:MAG: hypothetical protein EOP51_21185 [Sphingobacteriales bacterium]
MKQLLFLISGIVLLFSCSKNETPDRYPSPGRVLKEFRLEEGQVGDAVINSTGDVTTITVTVENSLDLKAVVPIIQISDGAKISPASGTRIDVSATKQQLFTITSESGQTRQWLVIFKPYDVFAYEFGAFTLKSQSANRFMQVAGDITFSQKFKDKAKAELSSTLDVSPVLWQKWHLIYKATRDGIKYYQIRNLFSGKFLNVPDGVTADGFQVEQYKEDATVNELWRIIEVKAGTYILVNAKTGLALTASGSNSTGAKVVLAANTGAAEQKWTITPLQPETYRDDAVVNFFFRNNPAQGSVAFDQGTSLPLSDGRVLWITQDAWDGTSLRDGKFLCNFFHSYNNSVMIQPTITDWNPEHTPNMTITDNLQRRPKQIFSNQPGTDWSWPGLGVQIGNNVWAQCGEGVGLGATNQSLYKLTPDAGNVWKAVRYTPAGMSGQVDVGYSTGMVKGGDGYVYSFGSKGLNFGYATDVFVARFTESDPLTWTFWNGSVWAAKPTSNPSARIASALGNVTVNYVNGKYVLMSMDQGFNCETKRDIFIATANRPTGPFTTAKYIYTIQEYFAGKYARYYTPSIHPESVNGRNELLLTYSLGFSGCGVESCQDGFLDPYYYRVKGIRVPYSTIGL